MNEFKLNDFDKINFELMKNKFDYFNSIPTDKLKKKQNYQLNVRVCGEKLEKSLILI